MLFTVRGSGGGVLFSVNDYSGGRRPSRTLGNGQSGTSLLAGSYLVRINGRDVLAKISAAEDLARWHAWLKWFVRPFILFTFLDKTMAEIGALYVVAKTLLGGVGGWGPLPERRLDVIRD